MLYSNELRDFLFDIISDMEFRKKQFVRNPEKDFSRKRKLSFSETIQIILTMEKDSVKRELLKFFDFSTDSPTDAAFNQQRNKILPTAFEYLFKEFSQKLPAENFYKGYLLVACDGSCLRTPINPNITETLCDYEKNVKPFNMVHLNALYDLLNHRYIDAVIQPCHKRDERSALYEMLDRYPQDHKSIIIADRGYISFNVFERIRNINQNYLIRAKDIRTKCSFLYSANLPDEEFDIVINEVLTQRRDKDNKLQHRRYIKKKTNFSFWSDAAVYPITYRVVRFKLPDGTYESLVTNLTQEEFSTDEIKEIYRMRWGIETSFRELKYAVGLINFHTIKLDTILQEIWAKLLIYNFSEAIVLQLATEKVAVSGHTKHRYQINSTNAVYLCRLFLRLYSKISAFKLETLIIENVLPVRLGRKFQRYTVTNRPAGFGYRTP